MTATPIPTSAEHATLAALTVAAQLVADHAKGLPVAVYACPGGLVLTFDTDHDDRRIPREVRAAAVADLLTAYGAVGELLTRNREGSPWLWGGVIDVDGIEVSVATEIPADRRRTRR